MDSSGYYKTGCWIVAVPVVFFVIVCLSEPDGMTVGVLMMLIFFAILVAILYWIIGTAKKVKEICVSVYDEIIGLFTVKREVKQKCPQALKAIILEKSKHSLSVGIFGPSNVEMSEKLTITGEGVVDDSIYVGQKITI